MSQYAVLSLTWLIVSLLVSMSSASAALKEITSESQAHVVTAEFGVSNIPLTSSSDSNTRIAYISQVKGNIKKYALYVADIDGHNSYKVFESNTLITSLSWSPTGRVLAYISYDEGKPNLYTHTVSSSTYKKWAIASGLEGGLAWSPSGARFVLSLTKDNNRDLYILDISKEELFRVTSDNAVDKDPVWMSGSSEIYFTSDRSGQEQVYKVSPSSGVKQVSDNRFSHSHPSIPAGGNTLYMLRSLPGNNKQVIQLKAGGERVINLVRSSISGPIAVSPSENMLVFASSADNKGVLYIQSIETSNVWRVAHKNSNLIGPAWSPSQVKQNEMSKHLKTTWAQGLKETEYETSLNKRRLGQGSAKAAYDLGKHYFGSKGIEDILGKGTESFRIAAKKGYPFKLSEYFMPYDKNEIRKFRVYGLKKKIEPTKAHNWAIDGCPIKKKVSCKNTLVIIVHANHKQWFKNAYDAAYILDKNKIPVLLIKSSPKTWGDNDEPTNRRVNSVSLFMNGMSLTNTEATFSSLLVQSAYIFSSRATYLSPTSEKHEITDWSLSVVAGEYLGEATRKWPKNKSISIYKLPEQMESARYMAKIRVR